MNTITFDEYQQFFSAIITKKITEAPYHLEDYFHYVEMNESRQNRWLKNAQIPLNLKEKIIQTRAVNWIVITEPWCGDAAHLVPLFYLMSQINPKINFKIALRDSNEVLMRQYLTNGTKSIPKLILRNSAGNDSAVWGPRPDRLQQLVVQWKAEGVEMDDLKIALQKWYNTDKGMHTFEEIMLLDF